MWNAGESLCSCTCTFYVRNDVDLILKNAYSKRNNAEFSSRYFSRSENHHNVHTVQLLNNSQHYNRLKRYDPLDLPF